MSKEACTVCGLSNALKSGIRRTSISVNDDLKPHFAQNQWSSFMDSRVRSTGHTKMDSQDCRFCISQPILLLDKLIHEIFCCTGRDSPA